MTTTAAAISASFARALAGAEPTDVAPDERLVGVEHEFVVRHRNAEIDFRELISTLDIDGEPIDPSDPHARRCRWGGVVTADGREAEIAIPPVAMRPGFARTVDEWATIGRAALQRSAPTHSFEGYSTHISVSVDNDVVRQSATSYAQRFAPSLMLMLDKPTSPGLLVRPRPNRLELCGEHAAGPQLRAASLFAAGSVLAVERGVRERRFRKCLPPRLVVSTQPSLRRFGLYVDRRAFGTDLYERGRSTPLTTRTRRVITADEHMHRSWDVARRMLEQIVDESELSEVDAIVDARSPLPLERTDDIDASSVDTIESVFGAALGRRVRPAFEVTCRWLAWHVAVFEVTSSRRDAIIVVPVPQLHRFLDHLDRGALDRVVTIYLATDSNDRVHAQAGEAGLYDTIGDPSALNLVELGDDGQPLRGRGSGGFGGMGHRPGKRDDSHSQSQPSRASKLMRSKVFVGGAVATVVAAAAVVAVVAAASGGGKDQPSAVVVPAATTELATTTLPQATTTELPTTTVASSTTVGSSSTVPTILRTGATSGSAAGVQDGTFNVVVGLDILTPTVGPGEPMQVTWTASLNGPNWGQKSSTGEWLVDCNDDGVNPRRESPIDLILIPIAQVTDPGSLYSIREEAFATGSLESSRARYPGLLVVSGQGDTDVDSIANGCDLEDRYTSTVFISMPADLADGEYYVVNATYPKRDWVSCEADCTPDYSTVAGSSPTIVIQS